MCYTIHVRMSQRIVIIGALATGPQGKETVDFATEVGKAILLGMMLTDWAAVRNSRGPRVPAGPPVCVLT